MGIVIGIVIGLVAIGGGAVLLFRRARTQRAEADAALEVLATTLKAEKSGDALTGIYRGRPCAITEIQTYGSEGTHRCVKIRIGIETLTTFELHPQTSALAARLVNDVEIGDPEFDRWFIVRTNDVAKVRLALAPDVRTQLIDWLRAGWFNRAWTKDGQLYLETGRGVRRAADVDRVTAMLAALERVAAQLE